VFPSYCPVNAIVDPSGEISCVREDDLIPVRRGET
jgi:hypothetical protein